MPRERDSRFRGLRPGGGPGTPGDLFEHFGVRVDPWPEDAGLLHGQVFAEAMSCTGCTWVLAVPLADTCPVCGQSTRRSAPTVRHGELR